jgi:hypothetical protein
MNFNVPLSGDIGYNRPVDSAPSVGSAVASFLSTAIKNIPEAKEPTNDERFASVMKAYQEKNPELRSTDTTIRNKAIINLAPQILSDFPEFAPEFNSWSNAMGAKIEAPFVERQEDARKTALIDWTTKDPEGSLAELDARNAATQNGVLNEQNYLLILENAKLAQDQRKLTIANLADKNVQATDALNTVKNDARNMANQYIAPYLDTLNKVLAGETIPLSQEMASATGFPEVRKENLEGFAQVARSIILNQIMGSLSSEFSANGIPFTTPTDEWVDSVMGPFDVAFTTRASEEVGTTKLIASLDELNAINRSREALAATNPGLLAAADLAKVIGGDAGQFFFQETMTKGVVDPDVGATIALLVSGNATGEQLTTYTQNMSTDDAKKQANATASLLNAGTTTGSELANSVTLFFETNNRGNNNAMLGVDTYNNALVKNAQGIVEQAAADPIFGAKVTENLSADIRKTLDTANEQVAKYGLRVEVENGFLVLSQRQPDGRWAAFKEGFQQALAGAALGGAPFSPEDLEGLKSLRSKWESLDKFAEIGSEIKDAFGMTQAPADSESSYRLPEEIKNDTAFIGKVQSVSNDLGINPNDLLRVIEFETNNTWSPSVQPINKDGEKLSSATGLIQFLESTAKGLGTTTEALSRMSRVEQMDYVARYLAPYKGRIKNFGDIYMAVHWPAGIGKDESYVMYRSGSKEYNANKSLDTNGDGTVTRGETIASVISRTGGGMAATPFTGEAQQFVDEAQADISTAMPPSAMPAAPQAATTETTQTAPEAATADMPEQVERPTTEGQQATSTNAEATVSREGQALIDSLGEVDKSFASAEELQAAVAAGELEAGDLIDVAGVQYIVRKDGSVRRVGQ